MVVLAVWVAVELSRGSIWWAVLAGGIGVYAAREFFIVFDPPDPEPESGPEPPPGDDPPDPPKGQA